MVRKNVDRVKALVALDTPAPLLGDVNGFTPFYFTLGLGYSKIASLLVEVSPPEALYMETAVGVAAPETAVQRDLFSRARARYEKCRLDCTSYECSFVDRNYVPADSREPKF